MLILGVDPGTARMGYGLVQDAPQLSLVAYGCLVTPASLAQPQRLLALYHQMHDLMAEYQPDELALERLFFNRNVNTAFMVGEARGIVLLAAAQAAVPVSEYTPLQVKQALTGYGRAGKQQMQEMVRMLLRLETVPYPDDAADALAVAICHAHAHHLRSLVAKYP